MFSLPRNSWEAPPLFSGCAGSCQNWRGLFWVLHKPQCSEGDSDWDHGAGAVPWLTPKHSHFEHLSSHALVLMEICLNDTMLLQPFWGIIQHPLRWDNSHWFQLTENYTLYFLFKALFMFFLFFMSRLKSAFSPKSQILLPMYIPQLDHACSKSSARSQPLRTHSQPSALLLHCVSLIKTDISHFSCNIPNQLFIIHTE